LLTHGTELRRAHPKAAEIAAELHKENGAYEFRFRDNVQQTSGEDLGTLLSEESLKGLHISFSGFRNGKSLTSTLERLLGEASTPKSASVE
jgi:hypothetical protein